MATPVVDLSLETPVNDQNYFRNGNFYSSFWTTPAGVPVPPGTTWTANADYWLAQSAAGTPTYQQSTDTPDIYSLFSAQLVGAAGVGAVSFGQQINGDLSATLRRPCTFSAYIENNTGQVMSPTLQFWTCNAFNNFSAVTLQDTINLQTCANASWTYVTATEDVSTLANAANGLFIVVVIPAGALAAPAQLVNFSRVKFQIGEVATEFSDDPGLFIQTPSVDSTMLQDGCIARPSLFAPNVIPSGSFVAGAIQGADIAANTVTGANLTATAVTDSLGYTPVDKAGDTGVGIVGFTNDTAATAAGKGAIIITSTSANASNAGFDPAIQFERPGNTIPPANTNSTTPITGRYIGLTVDGRFRMVDNTNAIGYLLDSINGVDTNSYQPASINYQALAQSLINIISPIGMIAAFAGPNVPANWLVCDGTAYPQSTYPALYAVIGTYWGAGSGGQQFQVPDFRGRAPIGYVNNPASGITGRAFGSNGGEEYHVLSSDELAYHNHTLHDNQHYHTYVDNQHTHQIFCSQPISVTLASTTFHAMTPGPGQGQQLTSLPASVNIAIQNASSNISIDPFGGNAGHNNMMPFAVAYYIIRAT